MVAKVATVLSCLVFMLACSTDSNGEAARIASPIADVLGSEDVPWVMLPTGAEALSPVAQAEISERTLLCMAEQGFQYELPAASVGEAQLSRPSSNEWFAEFGFGVSTYRFAEWALPPDLLGVPAAVVPNPEQDPNLAFMVSLEAGSAEFNAFHEALFGYVPGEDGVDYTNLDGCAPTAFRSVAAVSRGSFEEQFEEQLADMRARVAADPEVRAFEDKVARCTTGQGVTYGTQDDLEREFVPRLRLMTFGTAASGVVSADAAELGEMQREELELATAILLCGGGPEERLSELGPIFARYENEMIEEHNEEVDLFLNGGTD